MTQVLVNGLSAGNKESRLACRPGGERTDFRAHGPIVAGLSLVPGFLDTDTGKIYRSCFADGRPAPVHLLDAIPAELVAAHDASGKARSLVPSVISGYISGARFYTREEAAQLAEKRRNAIN